MWQRITVGTMADTLSADREAILLQGSDESGEVPARLLIDALAALGTYARAVPGSGVAVGGPAGC